MGAGETLLTRPEGQLKLIQDDKGDVRVVGRKPRNLEGVLIGKTPREAAYLTQQLTVDGGVFHTLASVMALEQAGKIPLAHNGQLLRDLIFSLSLIHAHLRHFYLRLLPDYMGLSELEKYRGGIPEILAAKNGIGQKGARSWLKHPMKNSFKFSQLLQFTENQYQAVKVLTELQRMIAIIGGKFPMVMSIVPGGVSARVKEPVIIRLEAHLREISGFLSEVPLSDVSELIKGVPEIKTQGQGTRQFICAGSIGDEAGPDAAMFPSGVFLDNTLSLFQPNFSESIDTAFYRIPLKSGSKLGILEAAPAKPEAYSWIKSPRYQGRMMETGAQARLLVTQLTGARSFVAPILAKFEELLGKPVSEANTTAGRMLALVGEIAPLAKRCQEIIMTLNPGQPVVQTGFSPDDITGEGIARVESPSGMVSHHLVLEDGRIRFYDIVSPGTWNGASRGEGGEKGPMETALNADKLDLSKSRDQLTASRIVQSYSFSMTDAVH